MKHLGKHMTKEQKVTPRGARGKKRAETLAELKSYAFGQNRNKKRLFLRKAKERRKAV